MKQNKKVYLLFALLLAMGLILVACGGGETDEPDEPVAAQATEEPMDEPMEDPTEEPMMEFEPMVLDAGGCDYGGKFNKIEAVDEYTVVFEMCDPDPAFAAKVAFEGFGIYPQEYLDAQQGGNEMLENAIGTGPYKLDAWNRGDSIVLKRNEDYWGEAAKDETMVIRWATEGATRLLELQSGQADVIFALSPDDFDTVKEDPNLAFLASANPNILYLAMTNTFEPWNDIRVRQAIAMGIDRQRLVENFYPDGSIVADYFTPCSIPNGCEGEPWYDFDPEGARELLAEAGFPDGFDTTIYYRDVFRVYLPEPPLVAVEFQTQLAENLGINATIEVMESGAFIDDSTNGRLDGLYLLGWGADYPHVTNFLDFHFSSANPQFGDPFPEIYEVLDQASKIADLDETAPLYAQANNAIKELVPMVPIAHGASADAALADADGAHARPFGAFLGRVVDTPDDTLVFVQGNEPISLYCADESDGETFRVCGQIVESLLAYELDSGNTIPALATACDSNADGSVWTCTLRQSVTFHDGSHFDANDVVASYAAGVDAASPNHTGNTGSFSYYSYLWGLMNETE